MKSFRVEDRQTRQPHGLVALNKNDLANGTVLSVLFGNRIVDVSGYQTSCTLVNGPAHELATVPRIGSVWAVSTAPVGGSRRIDLGTPPQTSFAPSNNFSMMLWMRRNDTAVNYPGLFVKQAATNKLAYYLGLDGQSGSKTYFAMAQSGVASDNAYESTASTVGQWYCYVGTYDGSTIRLYKDGVLQSSTAWTRGSLSASDGPLVILNDSGDYLNREAHASVCAAHIWARCVSADEALQVYENPWDLYAQPSRAVYFDFGGGTLISVSDTATGSDAIAIAVGVALTDTATGSDSLGMGASVPVSDSAVGSDTITISVALQVDDSSAGSDAVNVLTEILKSVTDSAVGSDAVSVNVALTQTDSATGTDTVGIAVTLTITDSATGSDAISVLQAMLISVADACTGTDTIGGIAVSVQLSDAGFATELVAITALVQVLESCSGMDVVVTLQPGGTRIVEIRFTPRSRAMRFALRGRDMTFTLH